ncbi:MAG: SGNH/GDSL hydrolase family protein [Verrucomicrobiales bacterium]
MLKKRSLMACLCVLWGALAAGEEKVELVEAKELRARDGLPNVLAKLEKGGKVKVGYLGGSITAAAGWRVQTREWLAKKFPQAEVSEINAAIGGTGSGLGAFRVGEHVLKHGPDLLFVEFAVNDGGTQPASILRSMEGIVRQTWRANPETDICFVYTLTDKMVGDVQKGKFPRAASTMEAVAGHYGIPSIHMGLEVVKLMEEGNLVFKSEDKKADEAAGKIVFSTDGVHPLTESGHPLYTAAVTASLEKLAGVGEPGPHQLGEPLTADNMENARLIPITEAMLEGAWEKGGKLEQRFSSRVPSLWQAKEPGAKLKLIFKGSALSCYDLVGPDGGVLKVTVDGVEKTPVKRIDGYCTYHRLASFSVLNDPEGGVHEVTIELTGEKLEKREILFESKRAEFDKNPERYAGHTWYLGGLLAIGELEE